MVKKEKEGSSEAAKRTRQAKKSSLGRERIIQKYIGKSEQSDILKDNKERVNALTT